MTGPRPAGFYDRQYGTTSEIAEREFAERERRRLQMFDGIMARLGVFTAIVPPEIMIDPSEIPSAPSIDQSDPRGPLDLSKLGTLRERAGDLLGSMFSGQQPRERSSERMELEGAAGFYGIERPDTIPTDDLRALVEARRESIDRSDAEWTLEQAMTLGYGGVAEALLSSTESLAGLASSFAQGINPGLREIFAVFPQLDPAMRLKVSAQDAQTWLQRILEGTRATLPDFMVQEQLSMLSGGAMAPGLAVPVTYTRAGIMEGAGNLVGYVAPGVLTYRAAAAHGIFTGRGTAIQTLGPIRRAGEEAYRGAVSGFLLEGGTDDPIEQKALAVVIGGGLGAVGGAAAGWWNQLRSAAKHVSGVAAGSFPSPSQSLAGGRRTRQPATATARVITEQPRGLGGGPGPDDLGPPGLPPGPPPPPPTPPRAGGPATRRDFIDAEFEVFEAPPVPTRPALPQPKNPVALANTKVAGPDGKALVVYHGTQRTFPNFEVDKLDPNALFGPGFYSTADLVQPDPQLRPGSENISGIRSEIDAIDAEMEQLRALWPQGMYDEAASARYNELGSRGTQLRNLIARVGSTGEAEIAGGYAGGMADPPTIGAIQARIDRIKERLAAFDEDAARQASQRELDHVRFFLSRDTDPHELARLREQEERILQEISAPVHPGRQELEVDLQVAQGNLDDLLAQAPQIRPMRLRIERPFDIDHEWTEAEMEPLFAVLPRLRDVVRDQIEQWGAFPGEEGKRTIPGEVLYSMIGVELGSAIDNAGTLAAVQAAVGATKAQVNELLQQAGFDGITHIGGGRTGGEAHRVWIAFKPDQVYSAFDPDPMQVSFAEQDAIALTKQAAIVDTPALDAMAQQIKYTDADVAYAMVSKNPGAVSIVRSVGANAELVRDLALGRVRTLGDLGPERVVAATVRALDGTIFRGATHAEAMDAMEQAGEGIATQARMNRSRSSSRPLLEEGFATTHRPHISRQEGLIVARKANQTRETGDRGVAELMDMTPQPFATGLNYRFVEYPDGRVDMLVSDDNTLPLGPIRAQLQEFGHFRGQLATTANGKQVVITTPGKDKVGYRAMFNGRQMPERFAKAKNIFPMNASQPWREAPAEYEDFKAYVGNYMARVVEESRSGRIPEWLDDETSSALPKLLDGYFDDRGIVAESERAVLEGYFNTRRVEDYRKTLPAEVRAFEMAAESGAARAAAFVENQGYGPTIYEVAGAKGFAWVPTPGHAGGELVDQLSTLRVPLADEGAVNVWLQNFERTVPDHTPQTTVPLEVASTLYPGNALKPNVARAENVEQAWANAAAQPMPNLSELLPDVPLDPTALPDPVAPTAGPSFDEAVTAFKAEQAAARKRGARIYRQTKAGGGGGKGPPEPPRAPVPFADEPDDVVPRRTTAIDEARPATVFGAPVARGKAGGWAKIVEHFDSTWNKLLVPMRTVFLQMEEMAQAEGHEFFRPWQVYQEVMAGVNRMTHEMRPWLISKDSITRKIRSRFKRDGTWVRVYEIEDTNERMREAFRLGFNQREVEALEEMVIFARAIDKTLRGAGVLNDHRYFSRYITHLRARQAHPGVRDPFADPDGLLPEEYQWLPNLYRDLSVDARVMDPDVLWNYYIRGAFWSKNVAGPMEQLRGMARDPRVPPKLGDIMDNWSKILQRGPDLESDMAIDAVYRMFKFAGITKAEAATILNKGFSLIHLALIGARAHVLFRDAISPMIAAAKVGGQFHRLGRNTVRYLRNGRYAEEAYDRAQAGGWLEPGALRTETAGFGHSVFPPGYSLPPVQGSIREGIARVGDVGRDLVSQTGTGGWNIALAGLQPYAKLNQFNRVMSGELGWELANEAIGRYQAVVRNLLRSRDPAAIAALRRAEEQLLEKSAVNVHPQPIQDEFLRLVRNGDYAEAANVAGRELANTQSVIGTHNLPRAFQSGFGRGALQMGSFSLNFAFQVREMLTAAGRRKSWAKGAASLASLGAITALLYGIEEETGWNFSNWIWFQALGYAGGPLVGGASNIASAFQGLMTAEENRSAPERRAVASVERVLNDPIEAAASIGNRYMNPFAGYGQTIQGITAGLDSPDPIEAVARYLVTGDRRGHVTDYRQMFEQRAEEMIRQSQQPSEFGQPYPQPGAPVAPNVRSLPTVGPVREAGPMTEERLRGMTHNLPRQQQERLIEAFRRSRRTGGAIIPDTLQPYSFELDSIAGLADIMQNTQHLSPAERATVIQEYQNSLADRRGRSSGAGGMQY